MINMKLIKFKFKFKNFLLIMGVELELENYYSLINVHANLRFVSILNILSISRKRDKKLKSENKIELSIENKNKTLHKRIKFQSFLIIC